MSEKIVTLNAEVARGQIHGLVSRIVKDTEINFPPRPS